MYLSVLDYALQRALLYKSFIYRGLLIIFCVLQVGCLDLIARAIIDPSGLATDVGTSLAESSARSLVSDQDVGSLSQMEQSISRLDDMIAQASDPNSAQELQALRDHMAQGFEEAGSAPVNNQVEGIGPGLQGYTLSDVRYKDPARRVGDVHADPALIQHQPYKQWPVPPLADVRDNNFERWSPYLSDLDNREHDRISEIRYWSQSIEPEPIFGYAINPTSGFLETGFYEPQERFINSNDIKRGQ